MTLSDGQQERLDTFGFLYNNMRFNWYSIKLSFEKDEAFLDNEMYYLRNWKMNRTVEVAAEAAKILSKYTNRKYKKEIFDEVQRRTSISPYVASGNLEILANRHVVKTLEKYADNRVLDSLIKILPDVQGAPKNLCKTLNEKKVYDALNRFNEFNTNLILSMSSSWPTDCVLSTIKSLDNHERYAVLVINKASKFLANKLCYMKLLETLDHYKDNNCKDLCDSLYKKFKETINFDYDELMRPQTYELVKNSKNPGELFDYILKNRFSHGRDFVLDEEVRENAGYEDIQLVSRAWGLVREIHQNRESKDLARISTGFKNELDRSISQGSGIKSKLNYLRQYCKEVTEKLLNDASELMVIYDA